MRQEPTDARHAADTASSHRDARQPSKLEELEHPSCGLAANGGPAHVYNEEAFRYFLEIERRRSELSTRPFLLLLIDLKKQRGTGVRLDSKTSEDLMSALALCVRETDFIGWYHEGRVAGAVLTQHANAPSIDVPDVVTQRFTRALGAGLPQSVVGRLQVRVYQLPTNVKERT